MYYAPSLARDPVPIRLCPWWVLLKSSQWPPISTCLALTANHASPSGTSHYHFCPGREKQRSKTALGDPNREYLKYQKNGKWGWGHFFNLFPLRQPQEEFSEGSRRKGWERSEGAGRHSSAGRKQDLEGSKEQWCESWSSNALATWRVDSLEKTLRLGKTEGKRRRGWQRMRRLDSITHSMDMNLSKPQEIVKNRGAWWVTVHGVAKNQTWL